MAKFRGLLLPLLACLVLPVASQAEQRWLHIRVDESGPEGEKVRINVPIELAEAIMPTIESEGFRKGIIRLYGLSESEVDLPKLIAALRDARDGEYVRVDSQDEKVRIRKEDGRLLIDVDESGAAAEKVHISIRMEVLQAMLTERNNELDALAALQVIGEEDGMLVTVDSEDETVRIWVDDESGEEEEDNR